MSITILVFVTVRISISVQCCYSMYRRQIACWTTIQVFLFIASDCAPLLPPLSPTKCLTVRVYYAQDLNFSYTNLLYFAFNYISVSSDVSRGNQLYGDSSLQLISQPLPKSTQRGSVMHDMESGTKLCGYFEWKVHAILQVQCTELEAGCARESIWTLWREQSFQAVTETWFPVVRPVSLSLYWLSCLSSFESGSDSFHLG
jgi:hypothetical protein